MKDPLFQKCYTSIVEYVPKNAKVLLAFSGGLDSTALFHLLREIAHLYPITIECVHIDHGWREESRSEALQLRRVVESYSIPFHLKMIESETVTSNKEEVYREMRYSYIQEVYLDRGMDVLLTAHQADDQAETILKRLFEGAGILSLEGISAKRALFGMNVVRPLLTCYRAELGEYLKSRGYSYIDDRTNYDTAYTRARTRHELIPYLEERFGKSVKKNLCRIGEESKAFSTALKEEVNELFSREEKVLDWELLSSLKSYQLTALIQELFPSFSASEKELLRILVKKRKIGKKVKNVEITREGVKMEDKF